MVTTRYRVVDKLISATDNDNFVYYVEREFKSFIATTKIIQIEDNQKNVAVQNFKEVHLPKVISLHVSPKNTVLSGKDGTVRADF